MHDVGERVRSAVVRGGRVRERRAPRRGGNEKSVRRRKDDRVGQRVAVRVRPDQRDRRRRVFIRRRGAVERDGRHVERGHNGVRVRIHRKRCDEIRERRPCRIGDLQVIAQRIAGARLAVRVGIHLDRRRQQRRPRDRGPARRGRAERDRQRHHERLPRIRPLRPHRRLRARGHETAGHARQPVASLEERGADLHRRAADRGVDPSLGIQRHRRVRRQPQNDGRRRRGIADRKQGFDRVARAAQREVHARSNIPVLGRGQTVEVIAPGKDVEPRRRRRGGKRRKAERSQRISGRRRRGGRGILGDEEDR